jgi:hypothetical protein
VELFLTSVITLIKSEIFSWETWNGRYRFRDLHADVKIILKCLDVNFSFLSAFQVVISQRVPASEQCVLPYHSSPNWYLTQYSGQLVAPPPTLSTKGVAYAVLKFFVTLHPPDSVRIWQAHNGTFYRTESSTGNPPDLYSVGVWFEARLRYLPFWVLSWFTLAHRSKR